MNKQVKNSEEAKPKQLEAYFQKFAVNTKAPLSKLHSAYWHPELGLFKSDATSQFCLDQKVGFEVNSQWYLYPEEAIYLFYKGKIQVKANSDNTSQEDSSKDTNLNSSIIDNGISLLRLVYSDNTTNNKYLGMHIWRCYEFLRRNSFHIKRDSQILDIDKLKEGKEEIIKKVKKDNEGISREPLSLDPVFRVYDTNQNYSIDRVSFYLLIVPLTDETFDLDMLEKIRANFKQNERLRLGLIDEEEVIIYDMKPL